MFGIVNARRRFTDRTGSRRETAMSRRLHMTGGFLACVLVLACSPIRAEDAGAGGEAVLNGSVVNEAERPVAGVAVSALTYGQAPGHRAMATTGADGTFRLPLGVPARDRIYAVLLAEAKDGRLGYTLTSQEKPEPVRLVLRPARDLTVRVTDGKGNPLAKTEVVFLANVYPIRDGRTDAQGRWTVRIPADVKAWDVFARKAGSGFDYATAGQPRQTEDQPLPLPAELTLTLDGARTLRVKTVDNQGKPLAGVKVGPWLIQKPGRNGQINLSGVSDDLWATSDGNGIATLDWLPDRFQQLGIVARSQTHHPLDHATWITADQPTSELTITLVPVAQSRRPRHPCRRPPGIGAVRRRAGAGERIERVPRVGPHRRRRPIRDGGQLRAGLCHRRDR